MQDKNRIVYGKRDNKSILSLYSESIGRRIKDILDLKDIKNYRLDLKKKRRKNLKTLYSSGLDH